MSNVINLNRRRADDAPQQTPDFVDTEPLSLAPPDVEPEEVPWHTDPLATAAFWCCCVIGLMFFAFGIVQALRLAGVMP